VIPDVILIANWRSALKIIWRRLCPATRFDTFDLDLELREAA
jgi:hypothetical protein